MIRKLFNQQVFSIVSGVQHSVMKTKPSLRDEVSVANVIHFLSCVDINMSVHMQQMGFVNAIRFRYKSKQRTRGLKVKISTYLDGYCEASFCCCRSN
jgi:hypothetical protein